MSRPPRAVLVAASLLFLTSVARAQRIRFDAATDTISVAGHTTLGAAYTAEAQVMFCPGLPVTNSSLFLEQYDMLEDKALIAWGGGLGGTCQTPSEPSSFVVTPLSISEGLWHHVAFVYDGTQQRVYLDGALIGSRAVTGDVDDAPASLMTIGAFVEPLGGEFRGSFTGLVDSLRISNVARYAGTSFVPPTGDLPSDGATLLLYDFNEPAGSPTVADASGNGHVGTLGVGFPTATPPELGVPLCSAFPTFCSGDGSAGPCPCGNTGAPGGGCDNSAATGGAFLTGGGTVTPDTVVLTSAGELATSSSVFLQGSVPLGAAAAFGDGLRCVGGTLLRLATKSAVGGTVSYPVGAELPISLRSATLGFPIPPGATRYYMVYYRDPVLAFCTATPNSTFNATNALTIQW